MSVVLFIATILMILSGMVFAFTYLWLNKSAAFYDLEERNKNTFTMARMSWLLSLIFALFSCLFANNSTVAGAITRASVLYGIISGSWLIVFIAGVIIMLKAVTSKTALKENILGAIKKILFLAVAGIISGGILAWLLG